MQESDLGRCERRSLEHCARSKNYGCCIAFDFKRIIIRCNDLHFVDIVLQNALGLIAAVSRAVHVTAAFLNNKHINHPFLLS